MRRAACAAQIDGRVMASLAEIRVPTLMLVGALDQSFLGATDAMAEKSRGRRASSSTAQDMLRTLIDRVSSTRT